MYGMSLKTPCWKSSADGTALFPGACGPMRSEVVGSPNESFAVTVDRRGVATGEICGEMVLKQMFGATVARFLSDVAAKADLKPPSWKLALLRSMQDCCRLRGRLRVLANVVDHEDLGELGAQSVEHGQLRLIARLEDDGVGRQFLGNLHQHVRREGRICEAAAKK